MGNAEGSYNFDHNLTDPGLDMLSHFNTLDNESHLPDVNILDGDQLNSINSLRVRKNELLAIERVSFFLTQSVC